MNKDDVVRMAQEVGLLDYRDDWSSVPDEYRECISDFAALVAAAERRKHQADIEKWKYAAVTAEKWRGMAMSRDGDGRTVQAVQAEARAAEREKVAAWMIKRSYATGHGDTTEDLLQELDWQISERVAAERSACAKVCDDLGDEHTWHISAAIRARGNP